jgi:hypothetical protein
MPKGISQQEVIDRLVIMGLFAIRTEALRAEIARPTFANSNRSYWRPERKNIGSGTCAPETRLSCGPVQAGSGTAGE